MRNFLDSRSAMSLFVALAVAVLQTTTTLAFTAPQPSVVRSPSSFITKSGFESLLHMAETQENEVVELVDDDEETTAQKEDDKKAVAPFLSQGEISEEAMQMDWNDPKQARVMFYIILSLIPVLFLIPLMLGSRDLIPVDALPPVPLN